jgi:hypothetical protein
MSPSSSNAMMHLDLVCCLLTFAFVPAREMGDDIGDDVDEDES